MHTYYILVRIIHTHFMIYLGTILCFLPLHIHLTSIYGMESYFVTIILLDDLCIFNYAFSLPILILKTQVILCELPRLVC
jgi:hypothetical protein